MMEGELSLVAGRSQREKRRSYKDLLREEEIIDAEVRKSSKKRLKDSEGLVPSGDLHKKKKKHRDDYPYKDHGSGSHHKKKSRYSEGHGSSALTSPTSASPHSGMTAMGLLQAITSPTAVGAEPCPTLPKKPSYPSLPANKERRRESLPAPKPAKKKQHVMREAPPVVAEEVELEEHYGGSYDILDDESSSSAEEEEAGQLVIDDAFEHYRKKNKKSKKSKKKKEKEKERRHGSKANGSSDDGLYSGGRSGSHSDKKRKKEEKARLKAEKSKKKVLTAYQIFSKEYRLSILEEQPGLDFGDLSKKLADAWKQLPEGDKQVWRERAEYLQHKMKYESTTSKHGKHSKHGQPKPTKDAGKPTKGGAHFQTVVSPVPASTHVTPAVQKRTEPAVVPPQNGPSLSLSLSEPTPSPLRDPEVDPIDAAAHLQLLGESLSLIGRRLQETEGMVTVSGSLSVLLDSVLCALGPLTCLTAQVPELNGCTPHLLSNTLDNIAYVMPGL